MSDEIYINVNEESNDIIVQVAEFDQVISVNGETGNVIVDKNTIGLSNVENISIVATSGHLQNQINNAAVISGIVYTTGNQTISGTKNFDVRPTVNGSGVFLKNEFPKENSIQESQFGLKNYYLTGSNDNYILDLNCYGGTGNIYLAQQDKTAIGSKYVFQFIGLARTTFNIYASGLSAPIPPLTIVPKILYSTIQEASTNRQLEFTLLNNIISFNPGQDYLFTERTPSTSLPLDDRYVWAQTGNQSISGVKTFASRPTVNGTGVLLSGEVIPSSTANYITVEVTDNPVNNGTNLLAAYAKAKTTLPNGSALSATNRLAIILPPAIYDLGTQSLTLDTQYIDIIGSTPDRSKHYIKSDVGITNRGTIQQTANNVKLYNLTIENVNSTYIKNYASSDPAAYFPSSNLNNTYFENINLIGNINVWSMRLSIEYSGTFKNCTGGDYAFGAAGGASGTFENCTGGNYSFGGNGTASGTFENCTGGARAFGGFGTASGTFENCTGGLLAFGGNGTASGTFKNCTGGLLAFSSTGAASGTFENCTGGDYSFGYNGTASGTFENCTGGLLAFGGNGTASGTFENCTGGNYSFGGDPGTASGTFKNCIGGDYAFGLNASGTFENCTGGVLAFGGNGTASGTFKDCVGGDGAFGGNGGAANGTFKNCTGGDYSFGYNGTASGTFENCTGGDDAFGGFGTASGAFKDCTGGVFAFGGSGPASGTFKDCSGGDNAFGGNGAASGTFENCNGGNNAFGGSSNADGTFENCSGGDNAFGGGLTGIPGGTFTNCFGGNGSFKL